MRNSVSIKSPTYQDQIHDIDILDLDCIEIGTPNNEGYMYIWANGRMWRAHRYSYEHHIDMLAQGQTITHRCDNRRCCNPNHLMLGRKTWRRVL